MLLLSGTHEGTQNVWSARATVRGEVSEVLAALTDPDPIAAWAPVGFEFSDPEAHRARARRGVEGGA